VAYVVLEAMDAVDRSTEERKGCSPMEEDSWAVQV
jgi:hypothetical protein